MTSRLNLNRLIENLKWRGPSFSTSLSSAGELNEPSVDEFSCPTAVVAKYRFDFEQQYSSVRTPKWYSHRSDVCSMAVVIGLYLKRVRSRHRTRLSQSTIHFTFASYLNGFMKIRTEDGWTHVPDKIVLFCDVPLVLPIKFPVEIFANINPTLRVDAERFMNLRCKRPLMVKMKRLICASEFTGRVRSWGRVGSCRSHVSTRLLPSIWIGRWIIEILH